MSTRQWAKREFSRAINNLDYALNHFKNLHERGYSEVENIGKVIELSTQMLLEIQDLLKKAQDNI
jgi:hypothetical protein